jgi:hypothetical protein
VFFPRKGDIDMTIAMVATEVSEVVFSIPPDTQDPTPASTADEDEFDVLVQAAREFGSKYGAPYFKAEVSFSKAFAENVDDFLRLRDMFPRQGSHATRKVEGKEYTWKSFCTTFLQITPEYFGQLVRKLRPGAKPAKSEPRHLEDTPAYRAGFRAGQEAAVEKLEEEPEDDSEDLVTDTEVEEDSDVPTVTQSGQSKLVEAVGYFATYAKDAPKFAEELRALVQHFGLARKISVELL